MDTHLSDHSGFEGLWADHSDGTVPAMPVVVQFNILEHLSFHRFPGVKSLAVNRLDLETVEDALGTGIVIAISLGAHAALEIVSGQQ